MASNRSFIWGCLTWSVSLVIMSAGEARGEEKEVGWEEIAPLVGDGGAFGRRQLAEELPRIFRAAADRGDGEQLEAMLVWVRALPEDERDSVLPGLVPELLKYSFRLRLEEWMTTPIPEADRPASPRPEEKIRPPWRRQHDVADSALFTSPGDHFLRLLAAGIEGDGPARAEVFETPWVIGGAGTSRHSDSMSKAVLRCIDALEEGDYVELLGWMEWTWLYNGTETDGAASGRDWSRPFAILYWDAARHLGLEPEDYLSLSPEGFGFSPGAVECGGEKTLLANLDENGVATYQGVKKLGKMLRRIPGHGLEHGVDAKGATTFIPSGQKRSRPLEVGAEVIDRCYDGILKALQGASAHHLAERSLFILAGHPERAFEDEIRKSLQSPHPQISAYASKLLDEEGRAYQPNHERPVFQLRLNGEPIAKQQVRIRQGKSGKVTATSGTSRTDAEGTVAMKRWDSTYLRPEDFLITFQIGGLKPPTPTAVMPPALWAANVPLAELLENPQVDIQTLPAELHVEVPALRKNEIGVDGKELTAAISLFVGDEESGLPLSAKHPYTFLLDPELQPHPLPSLPIGTHRLELKSPGCFPIVVTIEVTPEGCEIPPQVFRPSYAVGIRFVGEDGVELPRRSNAHPLLVNDGLGKVLKRYLREDGALDFFEPGSYKISIRGRDDVEPVDVVIEAGAPHLHPEVITLMVPSRGE